MESSYAGIGGNILLCLIQACTYSLRLVLLMACQRHYRSQVHGMDQFCGRTIWFTHGLYVTSQFNRVGFEDFVSR
jgi:hypothetical protein